ncbi:MAG: YgaP-like transmembrane domain [Candidatus Hodarchaeota archaeon]
MDTSRVFRIVIGAAIIIAGLIAESNWWILGVFPLIAGVINRCPSFLPGQSSCKVEQKPNDKKIDTEKIKL